MLIKVKNHEPQKPFYHSEDADLIGDVRVGDYVSIWFKTVLRADINYIKIGNYSNIQDTSVAHVTEELPVILGDYVTVGHNVIMHGCNVSDYVLLGMGSIILDNAKIGKGCIIAAGAVIKENTVVPDFSLVAGIPGTVKKTLDTSVIEQLKKHALSYVDYAKQMKSDSIVSG